METVLPIILYGLGSILIIVLIIIAFRVLSTLDKVNAAIDNVNTKLSQLDASFEIIDKTTSRVDTILDSVLGTIVNAVVSVFKKRGK